MCSRKEDVLSVIGHVTRAPFFSEMPMGKQVYIDVDAKTAGMIVPGASRDPKVIDLAARIQAGETVAMVVTLGGTILRIATLHEEVRVAR